MASCPVASCALRVCTEVGGRAGDLARGSWREQSRGGWVEVECMSDRHEGISGNRGPLGARPDVSVRRTTAHAHVLWAQRWRGRMQQGAAHALAPVFHFSWC